MNDTSVNRHIVAASIVGVCVGYIASATNALLTVASVTELQFQAAPAAIAGFLSLALRASLPATWGRWVSAIAGAVAPICYAVAAAFIGNVPIVMEEVFASAIAFALVAWLLAHKVLRYTIDPAITAVEQRIARLF